MGFQYPLHSIDLFISFRYCKGPKNLKHYVWSEFDNIEPTGKEISIQGYFPFVTVLYLLSPHDALSLIN